MTKKNISLLKDITPKKVWVLFITFFVILTILCLVLRFNFGKDGRTEHALKNGTRLEFNLSSGEFTGLYLKTDQKKSDENKDEPKKEDSQSVVTDSEKKDNPSKVEFAWLTEDFVGPKMPDDIIKIFTGDEEPSVDMKVDEVSLSQISQRPIVVIIVKGLGLSSSTTEGAFELPNNVTLGFSPYSPNLSDWIKRANDNNFDAVLQIPMETEDFNKEDPGPYSLITASSNEDNLTRLKMLLGLTNGIKAVYTEGGEVFSHNINSIKPVINELKAHGKYMIYGGGYSDFTLIQIADNANYPLLINDMVLDEDVTLDSINEKFREVERVAKEKGLVLLMAHPYPITLKMLQIWIGKLQENGIDVLPASKLLGKVIKKE